MAFQGVNKKGSNKKVIVPVTKLTDDEEYEIHQTFSLDHDLADEIAGFMKQYPEHADIMRHIKFYVDNLSFRHGNAMVTAIMKSQELQPPNPTTAQKQTEAPAQATSAPSRKRKAEEGGSFVVGGEDIQAARENHQAIVVPTDKAKDFRSLKAEFVFQEVSFSIPQRKKFTLEITAAAVRAENSKTGDIEFGIPFGSIEHILCLPVPEKAQKQFNFCIVPKVTADNNEATALEPIVFTVPDGPPKTKVQTEDNGEVDLSPQEGETSEALLRRVFGVLFTLPVITPEKGQFASATPEPHRKGEPAYHVKAHRGSKDGYLFFLSNGIFFGFKKPLLSFPLHTIDTVSFTSVLQRTFNLVITARPLYPADAEPVEHEFAMIDQADYEGISAYIAKHDLQNSSLAAERRAKKLNINPSNGEDGADDADAGDGETELAKAEREMQDAEDEEEEDYDPGSEGDSDGSGESDEDEDEDEEMDDGEAADGEDLVKDELGSEAEEVEMSDEE